MSDSLPSFLSTIETADSATALTEAVQNLADACLIEAIPTLIKALSYNNPGAAVAAVDGLVQLGEQTVPALLTQLDSHNYTARSWAIRALAGIGDPRGLVTLLGAATADFSMSVRRAAARGLGNLKWHQFPPELLPIAQAEVLEALLFVAQQDEEWVVRYAAVVGLEALSLALAATHASGRTQIQAQFDRMLNEEQSVSVRARALQAQRTLQAFAPRVEEISETGHYTLSTTDWEQILEKLYARKHKERMVIPEGDPRHYRELLEVSPLN